MKRFITAILLSAGLLSGATTTITGPVLTPFGGGTFTGYITVKGPMPKTTRYQRVDGTVIAYSEKRYTVTAGVISPALVLEANDALCPGTACAGSVNGWYEAVYAQTGVVGWTEIWVVPTSATSVLISAIWGAQSVGIAPLTGPPGPAGVSLPSQIGQSNKFLTTDGTTASWGNVSVVYNVKNYGAKGDERFVSDAVMTAGNATLTSATAAFTSADTGKTVTVAAGPQGVASSTYTSGGSITGTTGHNCLVAFSNGDGSGATGIVPLTGVNTIAGGTVIVITNPGTGFTTGPTQGTLSNGFGATCSGTASVTTTLSARSMTAIATYSNATTITLSVVATTTVSSAVMGIGTDDSTSIIAAITAAYNAGGGTLYFPSGKYLALSQLVLPNDGATIPSQPPLRFTGDGSKWDGTWSCLGFAGCSANTAASVLDLRYSTGTVAKIDTRGKGLLYFDHLSLEDRGDDTLAFVQTTNTTIRTNALSVVGSGMGHAASQQDAFVLGGGGTNFTPNGTATGAFFGFGTNIHGVFFDKIKHGIYGRAHANSVLITNNTWSATCGGDEPILLDGTGVDMHGGLWAGNLIQYNYYKWAITLKNIKGFTGIGNYAWDSGTMNYRKLHLDGASHGADGTSCWGCNLDTYTDATGDSIYTIFSTTDGGFVGTQNFTTVTVSGNIKSTSGNVQVGTSSQLVGNGGIGAKFYSPNATDWVIWNQNQNDFGLLKFGGITSAFPALKRNAASVEVRLADDSATGIIITKLPTSCTGLAAGTLWNDTGTPKICP